MNNRPIINNLNLRLMTKIKISLKWKNSITSQRR